MTTVSDVHGSPTEDYTKQYKLVSLPSSRIMGCSLCVFQHDYCSREQHITEDTTFKEQVGACGQVLNTYYEKL